MLVAHHLNQATLVALMNAQVRAEITLKRAKARVCEASTGVAYATTTGPGVIVEGSGLFHATDRAEGRESIAPVLSITLMGAVDRGGLDRRNGS